MTSTAKRTAKAAAHARSDAQQPRKIYPGRGDPIRIVPLYDAGDAGTPTVEGTPAAAAAPPQLIYRNGPLLTGVEVFTMFWGMAWQQSQSSFVGQINQFFDFILTSSLIDELAEYSVPGWKIGHGKRVGTITMTAPQLHRSVSDTAIQHMLQQEISTNSAVPQPMPNTLYFVYLPPAVRVVQGGSAS